MAAVAGLARRFLGSAVSNAAGYAVGGAVLPTLEPYTQDLANQTWRVHPVKPLPAGLTAEAVQRGFLTQAEGEGEASFTGIDAGRFATLRALQGQAPALETLLALRRRDVIDDGQLEDGIRQLGYRAEWRTQLGALRNVLPSVTDLIRFAVREVFNPAQRSALDLDAEYPDALTEPGRRIGLSPDTLREYWAAHWELPSYEQGAQMLYRGEISQAQFDGLLKALDYAPVWRRPLGEIARAIPTISDMIRFAVREVYNPAQRSALDLDAEYPPEFTAQAAKHGYREEDARDQWAAHWRLPSALQGYRMLWRGEINQAQLDALLKALDYAPLWREKLSNIAHVVPGRIDLKRLLKHEIITEAEVTRGYERIGYAPEDARRMTDIAVAELAASDAGQPWATRARSQLYTVAHKEYLDASISESEATALLARVGATAAERTLIVTLWDLEKAARRLELTPTQIRKARNADLYTQDQAIAELIERGMTSEDANTFLASDPP